jgi:hypothetical protein
MHGPTAEVAFVGGRDSDHGSFAQRRGSGMP